MKSTTAIILAVGLMAITSPVSGSTIIDFDSLVDSCSVENQYGALGITFGTSARDTIENTILSCDPLAQSAPNILSAGGYQTDGVISFSFSAPVAGLSFTAVSVEDGFTIELYRTNGSLLSTVLREGTGDPTIPSHFAFGSGTEKSGSQLISRVVIWAEEEFFLNPDSFGIDDLAFTSIPEPACLGLLMVGALVLRRRRAWMA